jgi:hypothetical protein
MGKEKKLSHNLFSFGESSEKNGIEVITEESEESVDTNLVYGFQLIQMLRDDNITLERLTPTQWDYLAYYFYKTNWLIRRIINLKTKIPLATINLLKPKSVENDIIQDYVYNYFTAFLDKTDWMKHIATMSKNLNIYGRSFLIVQTDYSMESGVNTELSDFDKKSVIIDPDNRAKITEIVNKYNETPDEISYEEIQFVLDKSLPFVSDFTGIKNLKVVSPLDINSISYNDDIGYVEIEIPVSDAIKSYYDKNRSELSLKFGSDMNKVQNAIISDLSKLGYAKSFVKMNLEAIISGATTITINNDETEDTFIIEFTNDESNGETPLLSIIPQLIMYEINYMKNKTAKNQIDKNLKIVTSEDATPEELALLSEDVRMGLESDDLSLLTANYNISIEDVSFSLKEAMGDMDDEDINTKIMSGLGLPDSLINGDSTYGSSFITIQMLNLETQNFVTNITNQIDKKLFKAIAVKKGMITFSLFGDSIPVHPKVSLYKGSVLVSDYIDTLKDLISDDKLPTSVLVEDILGMDYEQVMRNIKGEMKLKQDLGIDN